MRLFVCAVESGGPDTAEVALTTEQLLSSWLEIPQESLTEGHKVIRAVARNFAEQRLATAAVRMDQEDYFPADLFQEAGRSGLVGIALPEQYGGGGLDLLAAGIVREELARVSPAFAASVAASGVYVGSSILDLGNDVQREQYLPKIASGELIGSWALTEPDAGSDARSIRTISTRSGNTVRVRGQKCFITNAPVANLFVVLTRADASDSDSFRTLLLESSVSGVSAGTSLDKVGFRGSPTGDVFFDDVMVGEDVILGDDTMSFVKCTESLQMERILIVFSGLGIATTCLHDALEYSRERKQFGRPIAEFQLVQQKVANIATAVALLHSYGYALAAAFTRGRDLRALAAIGKYAVGNMVLSAATDAMQVYGGAGYIKASRVERFWRDARLLSIGGGTAEIQQVVIAQQLMKLFERGKGE